ncbi:MAG: FimB/Mfa2 family fimbrial subunit [Bacteroides sp.]|nr:FimB/Mfa2 family fimbrial subunit [Bacteroides sp.]
MWFGETTVVEYDTHHSVYPVYLVRETNRFNLELECTNNDHPRQADEEPLYTFEIITPESGAYGYDNTPRTQEVVTYHPYYLAAGIESSILSEARIRTMRLFAYDEYAYRLVVRHRDTREEVWSYDLMDLLRKSNRYYRPDGTPLPFQEYLDRECEWNLILQCDEDATGGFVAISIVVNDWIIWLRDIEI